MPITNPVLSDADVELLALASRSRAQLTSPGAPFELHSVDVAGAPLLAYRNAFATLPALLDAGRAHGERESQTCHTTPEGDRLMFTSS